MITAAIGAGVGAASSILGGIGKNRALKRQIRALESQKRQNEDWYNRRYNEDSTQRADAQAMLTRTAEMLRQRNQQSAGAAAVMGGTNESLAADREAAAKTMADAASQIVVAGEQRKDNIENQYRDRDQQLSEQINALKGQKKSGLDIASDALGGAMSGAMSGMGLGG